jgi:hypothetical protein
LANPPEGVSRRDLARLGSQIEHSLKGMEKQGHKHPQAGYLRKVAAQLVAMGKS